MGLKRYLAKRRFGETPEPKGGIAKSPGKRLRFCVQKHSASHLHYDFRLELDGVLKSWAVPKGPSLSPGLRRLAIQVEDHPFSYLSFKGRIPEGNYGAGTVELWDLGDYEAQGAKDRGGSEALMRRGLAKGHLKFRLYGRRLKGTFSLLRLAPDNSGKANWLLVKSKDEGGSLPSGRPGPMPSSVRPMLASLVAELPQDEGWIYEPKLDGYRAIAKTGPGASLSSRSLHSFNTRYPGLIKALKSFKHKALLDGEVACLDAKGRPSFQLLQDWSLRHEGELRYYVFDLLYLDGRKLEALPLSERKALLGGLKLPGPLVQALPWQEGGGGRFLKAMARQGMEGLIAKRAESPYRQGERGGDWLKLKLRREQEAVICGYTEPRGSRQDFGALILGVYEGKRLVYAGHTGGGFSRLSLGETYKRLKALEQKSCPFEIQPATNAPAHWVKPVLVAQVRFQEWAKDGCMRMPVFLGLRPDKKAREVRREIPKRGSFNGHGNADAGGDFSKPTPGRYFGPEAPKESAPETGTTLVGGRRLKLTHLDKPYFPEDGISKGDVIAYYRRMARWILPYLKDRPESLRRNPEGAAREGFFHKHFEDKPYPWMKTVRLQREGGESVSYLVCNDEATLAAMANLGCIEINPWNSRLKHLDKPDYAILDLDPEAVGFDKVVAAALEAHAILQKARVTHVVKTTGSRGMHLLVPLGARYSYEQARLFTQLLAGLVNARLPKITSLLRQPGRRQGKVYLDCLQNARGQTLAAPYCLRPKPGAPVSTPLSWSEVKPGLDPKAFNIQSIEARVQKLGDLFKAALGPGVDLKAALERLKPG